MPTLHHDRITADDAHPNRWMLVLHGIYGAGRNWGSVARRFVDARPAWGAVPVDLRQHGRSQGFEPPHTLAACADDLDALLAEEDLPVRAILGHSFGGKVALVWARRTSAPLERIWVIDSTPERREPEGSAWGMLRVLRGHPGPFTTREAAVQAVADEGYPDAVAQWMTTNLKRGVDGAFHWRLDPDDMEALLRDFFETDAWDVLEDPPEGCEIHVVKARASGVLGPEAVARIEAAGQANGRVFLHTLEGGHWLNADNPEGLQALLLEHMP